MNIPKDTTSSGHILKITTLLMATILAVYLVSGMMLAVLPPFLSFELKQSNFVVGLVAGLQFAVSLATRIWAGNHTDRHGPKSSLLIALAFTVISGVLTLAALPMVGNPVTAVAILAGGRAFLGAAQCFIIVGSVSWSMGLLGRQAAGKSIAQMGVALYIGMAAGAPIGSYLYEVFGLISTVWATFILSAIGLIAISPLRAQKPETRPSGTIVTVIKSVWKPGLGLSFASFGYGTMITFSVLLFETREWQPAWLTFTVFAVFFILARLLLGSLPDKIGGARVAQLFAIVQAAGMVMLALSPWMALGLIGSALTGFGYSLVYPGLGKEAVMNAPDESRGMAIAVYTGFLEIALGITTPLLGLLANGFGLGSIFLVGGISALGTVFLSAHLKAQPAQI